MSPPEKGMRLSLCTIVTSRVEEMRAFYSGLLGQAPQARRDNFFLYGTSRADLALWRSSEFEAHHGGMLPAEGGSAVLLELEVEDVAAEYDRVRRLGFTPEEAPRTLPWGHTQFSLRDPEGNLVVLFSEHPGSG